MQPSSPLETGNRATAATTTLRGWGGVKGAQGVCHSWTLVRHSTHTQGRQGPQGGPGRSPPCSGVEVAFILFGRFAICAEVSSCWVVVGQASSKPSRVACRALPAGVFFPIFLKARASPRKRWRRRCKSHTSCSSAQVFLSLLVERDVRGMAACAMGEHGLVSLSPDPLRSRGR